MSERLRNFGNKLRRYDPVVHFPEEEPVSESIKEEKVDENEFRTPSSDAQGGEYPIVDFTLLMNVYRADPLLGSAIDFMWESFPRFHTTMNPEAADEKIEIDLGDGKRKLNAKEVIDLYNKRVALPLIVKYMVRDVWATGNAFLYKRSADILKLQYLPLDAINKIYRGERRNFTRTQGYKIGYELSAIYGGKLLQPSKVIHIKWNPINDEAFGSGILQRFALKLPIGGGEQRKELYKILGSMVQAMSDQFEIFSAPNELWNFPGIGDAKLKTYDKKILAMPKKGRRITSNIKGASVQSVIAERSRGFDSYVEFVNDAYIVGTKSPLSRLFSARGFTEATAREAVETAREMKVTLQDFIELQIKEQIWIPVLDAFGFDTESAAIDLIWESAKTLEPEDVIRMMPFLVQSLENHSMKPVEYRRILRDVVGLPLDKDDNVEIIAPERGKPPTPRTGEAELTKKKTGPQERP